MIRNQEMLMKVSDFCNQNGKIKKVIISLLAKIDQNEKIFKKKNTRKRTCFFHSVYTTFFGEQPGSN